MALNILICILLIPGIAARYPRSAEGELRHFLLNQENHSPRDRPVLNASDTVVVGLDVEFYAMLDLNEKDQILTTASWLTMTWTDERMSWDPSNFSGVDLIHMYVDEIWIPKIFLSNSLSEEALGIVNSERGSILLTSNGHVHLGAPVVQSTQCHIIITYFPFDTQLCPFHYIPETMLAHQMYFYIAPPKNERTLYSNQWDLLNVTVFSGVFPVEEFVEGRHIDYYTLGSVCVHLRRDPTYYITALLLPSTFLCVMSFVTFLAPPDSGERISLGVSMVLGLTVFQLLIVDTLPSSSKTPPIIGTYLTATFILACLAVPFSLANIAVAYGDRRLWILKYTLFRNILLEKLPNIFCTPTYSDRIHIVPIVVKPQPLFNKRDEVITLSTTEGAPKTNQVAPLPPTPSPPPSPGRQTEKLSASEKTQLEARTVALVMDRLFLLVFIFVFFAVTAYVIILFGQDPGRTEESCVI
ncbi:neuronal acetylcholine receptor subunit alpha-7-like isoform X3 [Apostichopus japonicus]|uniref:neuronal acetylcholine receptor subunit alpha-7-like isoform X3 n=1 Tax=Stichopus japonicus TaxID=307972 RepID=UPI003AB4A5C6